MALMDYLKTSCGHTEVTQDHRLDEDLNLDSLDVVELVAHMEEVLSITVDDEDLFRPARTVGELISMIKETYGLD